MSTETEMVDRLPEVTSHRCPRCRRGFLTREGPLEWCIRCAYESTRSREIPDELVLRMVPKVSEP